ncbi:glycosyltransferase [Paraburkholderia sp.]|uniref:glycosyltransferase family 2 protein n=1 Tax=Paraburkholderia sp. TaxID=1926495 RepID=UPI002394717E|nr:glycosyltransferase [Paraburkholderia sp.]MDE1184399.1 glycosyltransferase [Paraburkholderia sp.]
MNARTLPAHEAIDGTLSPTLISICIPTCNRAQLLEQAIESCLAQSYPDVEIVINDDSRDESAAEVERMLLRLRARGGAPIRYERNVPRLGQANNVNRLFARARGARLVLLHDDDLLAPGALDMLARCWTLHPDVSIAFGKQRVVSNDGTPRADATERLNRDYLRIPERAGLLKVPALAGIDQMFPNNGYLIDTLSARAIGYDATDRVLDACDFDFGLRLCCAASGVCFVDEFIAMSRETEQSISRHALPAMHAYAALAATDVPADARAAREAALRRLAPRAASAFARAGQAAVAWRILLSSRYPMRERLSARFVFHAMLALRATLKPRHAAH